MNNKLSREPAKIVVECPYCHSTQKESPYVKSTMCFSCGKHIMMSHGKAKGTPQTAVLATKSKAEKNLIGKFFSGLFGPKEYSIRCFQCGHRQTVSSSASSTQCGKCSTYIELQNYKISSSFSRAIRTQGSITIASNGELTSSKVYCSSALIQGGLRGTLLCSGTVEVRKKGRIAGTLEAEKVIIAKRSEVEFSRAIKVHHLEIKGKLDANVYASGTVTISPKGSLIGTVTARGLNVEKGGLFSGQLTIGDTNFKQGDFLQPLFKDTGKNKESKTKLDDLFPVDGTAH